MNDELEKLIARTVQTLAEYPDSADLAGLRKAWLEYWTNHE